MNNIKRYFQESIKIKNDAMDNDLLVNDTEKVIVLMTEALKKGNKILVAGNGGSAADAQHFAAELVCRFKKERRGLPVIALSTDTSIITACANDYDFDQIFARQVEALSKPEDIFFGISTSGDSPNVINGVKEAQAKKMTSICLLGRDGGELGKISDLSIVVGAEDTARIQEVHMLIEHILCEEIENKLFS